MMKAMMLTGIRQMEMREVPEPVIKDPGDVKIRMSVVGICGSDIHYYTWGGIGSQKITYPFTVGHEASGTVVETGSGVTRVKPGDRIAIDPSMPCFKCDQCLAGRAHTCRHIKFLGCPGQAEGPLSEYLVIPETSCFVLSDDLSFDQGAISEPLSIGIYSVKKSGDVKGLRIGVLGFGPIGMSVMLAARAMGAEAIYVTDKIEERLVIAKKESVTWTGNPLNNDIVKDIRKLEPLGLDIVFECCGQQEALDQAIALMKPGGKIIVVGIPETKNWSVSVDETRRNENTLLFIRRQVDCVEEALEMMKSGKIDVVNMATHHFPLSQAKEAFDLVTSYRDGVMKAMIDI